MSIGTQVHAKEKNANVTTNIIEQMGIADNIIKALKASSSKDADVTVLLQDMNALNDIYNNFKSVKEIKETDPDVIDPAKLTISVDELLSFSQKVSEIRNRIVKG
jgi:protein-tyrosine-phosphatase